MELDSKEQVLVAIYTEYQKDMPDMDSITSAGLGIPKKEFSTALSKLRNEGFVDNMKFMSKGRTNASAIDICEAQMSSYGIEYVEKKLEIEKNLRTSEKVTKVIEKTNQLGLTLLAAFATKALDEISGKIVSL